MPPRDTLSAHALVPLEDISRRDLLTGALATVLLIGCGSDGEKTAGQAAPQAAPATPTTRTIIDAAGRSVSLPNRPQRVLALSEPDLDAALALDVKPAGTLNGRGQTTPPRYLGERLAGIPVIGNLNQPDLEKAVQLRADAILVGGYQDNEVIEKLARIAPSVVTFNLGEDWKTHFRRAAEALGREAEAAAWMARYVTRVQEVRARLGRNGTAEVSITRWNPQGPAYMLNDSFAARVLADIGLKRPAAQQQPGVGHSPPLSLEQIGLIDADWLFLGTLSPEGDAVAALETAKAHPLFQQLRAVRAGHVVPVDGSQWTSLGGPLAALAILDQVAQAMAAN